MEDEIELKTAPADFRFPTTNQTRHCFTRYIEFHRLTSGTSRGKVELLRVLFDAFCFNLDEYACNQSPKETNNGI